MCVTGVYGVCTWCVRGVSLFGRMRRYEAHIASLSPKVRVYLRVLIAQGVPLSVYYSHLGVPLSVYYSHLGVPQGVDNLPGCTSQVLITYQGVPLRCYTHLGVPQGVIPTWVYFRMLLTRMCTTVRREPLPAHNGEKRASPCPQR